MEEKTSQLSVPLHLAVYAPSPSLANFVDSSIVHGYGRSPSIVAAAA